MKKIDYLIGTRPEVIRSAAIVKELEADKNVDFRLIHTGQHFDENMDGIFFKELGLNYPNFNLNIGPVSQGQQFAKIIVGLEEFYKDEKPDTLIVFGDTNSSLAAAIIASKLNIHLTHIEAGCREYEMDMPEEVNRKLIDHCSRILFPVSKISCKNLIEEKVSGDSFFIGDPLWTVFSEAKPKAMKLTDEMLGKYGLEKNKFILLTTHRGKNVDDKENLTGILESLTEDPELKVIFPVHPRTKKNIENFKLGSHILEKLILIEPISYLEILALVASSKFVVTDSGGLQKEVFWLSKPCVIIRDHTAWIEPIIYGTSFFAKPNKEGIKDAIAKISESYEEILKKLEAAPNPYVNGDVDITKETVRIIKDVAGSEWRDDSNYEELDPKKIFS